MSDDMTPGADWLDELKAKRARRKSNVSPAEKYDDYVRRIVDRAPPFTPDQAERIAYLLQPQDGR